MIQFIQNSNAKEGLMIKNPLSVYYCVLLLSRLVCRAKKDVGLSLSSRKRMVSR